MENRIHVPLQPGKLKRKGMLISGALPGILLMLSALGINTAVIGELLLKIFSFVSGGLVIFISFRTYLKPGGGRWLGADMTMVFTGFLILAIGSKAYEPLKGFQPAHLYFLTAFLMIFKGVMFPDAKIKRGFLVGARDILFQKRAFTKPQVISKNCLAVIRADRDTMYFRSASGEQVGINLSGFENLEATRDAIIAAIAEQQTEEPESN